MTWQGLRELGGAEEEEEEAADFLLRQMKLGVLSEVGIKKLQHYGIKTECNIK